MLKVLDPCAVVRVQSWAGAVHVPPRVGEAFGISWPQETGAVASGNVEVLCIGPSDWLAISHEISGTALAQTLNERFAGSAFRATNLSSALTRIRVEGIDARALLAKGCSLELHPQVFVAGRTARTRFANIPVVIRCIDVATFECIVARSHTQYAEAWLTDGAECMNVRQ
jgi:sarcosine oxidase, subunit gamma